nr:hypothetical protein [Streptomyces polyasparticus]
MNDKPDVRVLGAQEGRVIPSIGHVANRFLVDGTETEAPDRVT